MRNKKGQSEIIITVLLILLVIIMLIIIWNIVVPIIQKSRVAEDIGSMTARLEIQKGQTNLIANSSGCVFVTLKRAIGAGNVSGAKIIFFSDSGQEVKDVSGRLNEQEWKKFDVCLTNPNVTGLRVYPLLISDEGESVTGKIYDEVGKVAGSASVEPSCTPQCSGKVCGNDGCGGSCGTCGSGQCIDGVCSLIKEISGCSVLNESNTLYKLTNALMNLGSTTGFVCMNVTAENVTLDCQNNIIDGTDGSKTSGVYIAGKNNLIVKNCIIEQFENGIFLNTTSNTYILGTNTLSHNDNGVKIYAGQKNKIENTIIQESNDYGIYIISSIQNNITGVQFIGNDEGIRAETSANQNIIKNNRIVGSNPGIGLRYSSVQNIVDSNIIEWTSTISGQGIVLYDRVTNNQIINNNISTMSLGIYFYSASNSNNIVNNTLKNVDYGMSLESSSNTNTIQSNKIQAISMGIQMASQYNVLYNNLINASRFVYFTTTYSNYWSTTATTGTNIIGGPTICGNVYVNSSNTGFSQTCTDVVAPIGVCDSAYTLASSNVDSCPLKI